MILPDFNFKDMEAFYRKERQRTSSWPMESVRKEMALLLQMRNVEIQGRIMAELQGIREELRNKNKEAGRRSRHNLY